MKRKKDDTNDCDQQDHDPVDRTLRFSVTSSGYFVVSGQCYSFYVAVPVSAGRNLP